MTSSGLVLSSRSGQDKHRHVFSTLAAVAEVASADPADAIVAEVEEAPRNR
jgi:hypothetical protein